MNSWYPYAVSLSICSICSIYLTYQLINSTNIISTKIETSNKTQNSNKAQNNHQNNTQQQIEPIICDVPNGITNQGNTCFVGSLLQAFSVLNRFSECLQVWSGKMKKGCNDSMIFAHLLKIMNNVNDSSEQQSVDISEFITYLQNMIDNMDFFSQQDAQELYLLIMEWMEHFVNDKKKDRSIGMVLKESNSSLSDYLYHQQCIDNERQNRSIEFVGFYTSYFQCNQCNKQFNIRMETFTQIHLNITDRFYSDICQAIHDQYNTSTYLSDVNCLNCTINTKIKQLQYQQADTGDQNKEQIQKLIELLVQYSKKQKQDEDELIALLVDECDEPRLRTIKIVKSRSVTKHTYLCKLPNLICIYINRLLYNPMLGDYSKQHKFIKYPEIVESKYLFKQKQQNNKKYELLSMVLHYGGANSGHYVCVRANHSIQYREQKWFMVSDSQVNQVEKQSVMNEQAYMLFYQLC